MGHRAAALSDDEVEQLAVSGERPGDANEAVHADRKEHVVGSVEGLLDRDPRLVASDAPQESGPESA